MPNNNYQRAMMMVLTVFIVILLHTCVLFWYIKRPVPTPLSVAAPLPMISMELSAPPSPISNQPSVPPLQPPTSIASPKPEKPKVIKQKPKATPSERLIKQVEKRKNVESVENHTPASTPSPAEATPIATPQVLNHDAPVAPSNDTYVPANSNVAYLNNPAPEYPLIARQRHWQGTVLFRVHVNADGQALQVNIQHSSGHDILDESALDAVKDWHFVPAKRGDIPETSWVTVPIVFELN